MNLLPALASRTRFRSAPLAFPSPSRSGPAREEPLMLASYQASGLELAVSVSLSASEPVVQASLLAAQALALD